MADKKISALTGAATPLDGSEVLPIVQSGSTVKVSVANLTFGRAITATNGTFVGNIELTNGADRVVQIGSSTNYNYKLKSVGDDFQIIDGSNNTRLAIAYSTANVTVGQGNLVMGTAGKGIDFSANTHAAGMTSELLNDYEEGTFTPVLSSSGTPPTVASYLTQYGSYTKIGNRVFVTVSIRADVTNAGTGYPVITGLPYAANGNCFNGPAWGLATLINISINGSFVSGATVQLVGSSYNVTTDFLCFSLMYEV